MYDGLKYIHILAAMVWVGGAFYVQLLSIRASRSTDPADLPRLGADVGAIASKVFPIASIILFVAGAAMTIQRWGNFPAWISTAILLWFVSLLAGVLYIGPNAERIGKFFAAEGPTSVAGRALMQRVFLVARLELVSFAVIVALMVFKPGSGA
jgi:uncharacterized membrane protein